jgi:hypothetical protein
MEVPMKKMMIAVWATAVMLVTASSLLAHHALVRFDTTKPVTVRGTVVLFQRVNPHSLLVLDEKQETGQTRRWVIEGPGAFQFERKNIGKDALKAGDTVEVCGYILKPGFESQRTISEMGIAGLNMDGELLTMPNGNKRTWSDYGVHKCFPAEYTDSHTK